MMQKTLWKVTILSLSILGLSSIEAIAQERTPEEFKEYVQGVVGDRISAEQLDQFVKMVDEDGDGTISEAEFENRMDAFQKVMSGEAPEQTDNKPDQKNDQAKKKSNKGSNGQNPRSSRWEEMNRRMQAQLERAGISPGNQLPDVSGLDIHGKPLKLADLKGHYSVIVSGCLT